ncbi:MAG: phage tail tape measure protein [Motilibacteraceae bacterium]
MADRSVVVRLRAEVDGLKRGMAEATKAVKGVGDEAEKSSQRASTASERMIASASKNKAQWETAGRALIVTGAAVAAGIALSVKTFADFDAQMSQVKTLSHATSREMVQLTDAALSMGQAIGFSASQTAEAETELVKAGLSVKDILGGALVGALRLAAAGQIDVGEATTIAASAMTQFKLSGQDVPHIADLLAAGADKALGGVGDLGQALSSAGTVAAQFGWSLEETVGTLAEFAQNAQIGEKGGTLLRQMLLQLVNPSKQARDLMEQYGFSITDANGEMVNSSELAGRLQKSFGSLTPEVRNHALAVLFGAHAIQGANILMSDGAKVNADWVKSVNETGFAAQQAAGKMDNLKGDLAKLRAALENDLIKSGSVANGTLRTMTQGVTAVVKGYGDLPRPLQGAALGLGAVTGATALTAGGFLLMLPRITETIKAFRTLKAEAPAVTTGLSRAGKAAGAVAGYIALASAADALYRSMGPASMSVNEMEQALLDLNDVGLDKINAGFAGIQRGAGLITSYNVNSLADAARKLAEPSLLDRLNDFAGEIQSFGGSEGSAERTKLIEQVNTIGDALGQLVSSGHADLAASQFEVLAQQWQAGGGSIDTLRKLMPGYSDALAAADNEQTLAAKSAAGVAGGVAGVGQAASDATLDVDGFDKALKHLFDQTFSVEEATDSWKSSLLDLRASIKENGKQTEGYSAKAIANREALRTTAQKAYDLVQAYADTGASASAVTKKSQALKAEFIKQAEKAGYSRTAAERYAAALDEIPGTYRANIKATDGASGPARNAKAALDRIPGNYQATITTRFRTIGQPTPYTRGGGGGAGIVVTTSGSGVVRKADGGTVVGQGGSRQDNVPALLSPGEEVIRASEASKHRGLLKAINAGMFADGGTVGRYFDAPGMGSLRMGSSRPTVEKHYHVTGVVNPDIERLASAVVQRLREQDAMTPTYSG